MKLATYQDGSRDGQLVVVSRDLATAHFASACASRLQQVLDDWNFLSPQLQDLYVALNQGRARHAFSFDPRRCMAPLPRAYQWVAGAGRHDPGPPADGLEAAPTMLQGASDDLLGPHDDACFGAEALGIDFNAGLAVITGDVAMGASAEQALDGVRLLMLANGWALRASPGAAQPAAAFGPVAVTVDELGKAWQRGRLHLGLQTRWNGKPAALADAGAGMALHFGQLIAHLARTRNFRAGAIVGTGALAGAAGAQGFGSIAALRATEALQDGAAQTPYLRFGDTLHIALAGRDGLGLLGAIEQRVVGPGWAAASAAAAADDTPDPGHAGPHAA